MSGSKGRGGGFSIATDFSSELDAGWWLHHSVKVQTATSRRPLAPNSQSASGIARKPCSLSFSFDFANAGWSRRSGLGAATGSGTAANGAAIPAKLMPPTSWLNRPDQSQDTIGIRHDVGKNRPRLLDPHEPTPVGMEGEPQLPLWPHTPPEP